MSVEKQDLPSFADFLFGESDDPAVPPSEFVEARNHETLARAIYEPVLAAAPGPRSSIRLRDGVRPVINLASYDYLGLGRHPEVLAGAGAALNAYGTGACGSPMFSGCTDLHRELEQRLSNWLGRESTMLFNSGYVGASATLGALLRRRDVAVLDARAHASLRDGAAAARAQLEPFEHNEPSALDAALARHAGKRRLIAIEGIYSMDGDCAPLPALLDVAEAHGVSVFLDEAHSILACGPNGRGIAEQTDCESRIALYYGTLSKAFAGMGGFLSGKADTIDYVRFFARGYGFSCALPPATVGGLLAALDVAQRDGPELRGTLRRNADYFRSGLAGLGCDTGNSTSHVVPVLWHGSRRRLYEVASLLRTRGLLLPAVDFPVVPTDGIRFRASITAAHTKGDMDEALNIIGDTFR